MAELVVTKCEKNQPCQITRKEEQKLFMILSNILVGQCQELMVHKELINVICMGVLSACMFVYHMYAVPMEPERGLVPWN